MLCCSIFGVYLVDWLVGYCLVNVSCLVTPPKEVFGLFGASFSISTSL